MVSAGSVSFKVPAGGRGTEVRVHLQYEPPAGKVGAAVAWPLGHEPSQTIREDRIQRGEIDPSFVITHRVSLEDAPLAYRTIRDRQDGCIKVVTKPQAETVH